MPPLVVEMTAKAVNNRVSKAARGQRSKSRSFPGRAWLAAIVLAVLLSSCETRTEMIINPDEIPIYPNAQGVIREGPLRSAPDVVGYGGAAAVYVWRFTTSDPPETVWRYYENEMGRRWDFHGTFAPQAVQQEMDVSQTCPFYALIMTSKATDSARYSIALTLFMGYCA